MFIMLMCLRQAREDGEQTCPRDDTYASRRRRRPDEAEQSDEHREHYEDDRHYVLLKA
jgi:hypothetical protein